MNDSQTTAGSTSNQYGSTQNPQTPGGQNLSGAEANLQTVNTPNLFTGTGSVSITQVGDAAFSPYTPENSTSTTIAAVSKPAAKNHYPIIIGSVVLIIIVVVVSWLFIRKQPSY